MTSPDLSPMGNDVSLYAILRDHPNHIHSFSPGALSTDSLIAPDAEKGYLKI